MPLQMPTAGTGWFQVPGGASFPGPVCGTCGFSPLPPTADGQLLAAGFFSAAGFQHRRGVPAGPVVSVPADSEQFR